TTKGGKTTDMGVRVNPVSGEQAVSLAHGSEQRKVSVTAGTKDGTTTLGGAVKVGPVTVHGGVRTTNKVTQGEIGSEGIDATIREFVGGGASYVEQHKGFGGDGGADVEYGPFGAGGGGHVASDTKRCHFRAGGAEDTKLPFAFPGLSPQTPAELDGKNSVGDVDVDKLQRGEGYSFEHSKESGQEGRGKVILSVSLGHDESAVTDTVIARDGRGDLRVMVAQADETAIKGGVSAGDKVSIGGKATEGKSASVSFTAHGPEGEK